MTLDLGCSLPIAEPGGLAPNLGRRELWHSEEFVLRLFEEAKDDECISVLIRA